MIDVFSVFRFGDGYMLDLRVSGDNPDMAPIVQYVLAEFPSAVIKEQHFNMVQFQLGVGATSLAKLFGTMEAARQRFSIEDYSVTQTTLDQVQYSLETKTEEHFRCGNNKNFLLLCFETCHRIFISDHFSLRLKGVMKISHLIMKVIASICSFYIPQELVNIYVKSYD